MTEPDRLIKASDIIAAPEVRDMCNVNPADRHTIKRWRAIRGFPGPVRVIERAKGQDLQLWSREDVQAWLDAQAETDKP